MAEQPIEEKSEGMGFIPSWAQDANPIFELYTLFRDAENPKITDSEIRERIRILAPKLKILFAPPGK
jgi:hypothetical protein